MRKLKRYLLAVALAAACAPAVAGVQSDLNSFFDSMGLNSNVTPPGAYQGQTAGYYTGGNLFARAPVRNYTLMTVQMPSARAGCGGIDMFAGGFSFINSDQLVAMMKNIGSNAVGLAFQVALSTISPKLSGLLQDMQDMANKINAANVNSCEAAANLLGNVLPRSDASNKALCQSIGTDTGLFGDYAYARQECGTGGQRGSVLASARSKPDFKDVLVDGNITWRALKKLSLTSSDTQLAEMTMSMVGAIIYPLATSDGVPGNPRYEPPALQLTDSDLAAFLHGGDVEMLRCQDGTGEFECLTLTQQHVTIPASSAYAARVKVFLRGMVEAMQNDTALSQAQINLLNETSLPVYKMLNVATAYNASYAESWLTTYAEGIAIDLLYQYFNTMLKATQNGATLMLLPKEMSDEFQQQVRDARHNLEKAHSTKLAQVNQTIQMMQESMTIERMLISAMSPGLSSSVQWSKAIR
ncbi:conjugal transfer protein TraH [Sulfurivermis fontis]|uniref:conjugal transfer protein TraH n=1 Tax=Sulfurivermis fontis TaxID=1972068 RepID=UPI000FDA866D|nr:conjugal transfer protein TraH [Sulfurivermis fontis]